MTNLFNIGCILIVVIACIFSFISSRLKQEPPPLAPDILEWIDANGFDHFAPLLADLECQSLEELVEVQDFSKVSSQDLEKLINAQHSLKEKLVLDFFLSQKELKFWIPRLENAGIVSLEDLVQKLQDNAIDGDFFMNELKSEELLQLATSFAKDKEKLEEFSKSIWAEMVATRHLSNYKAQKYYKVAALAASLILLLLLWLFFGMVKRRTQSGFFHLLTGRYLDIEGCHIEFHWQEPATVGNTVSFLIQFFQGNGQPYPISDADNLLIEITQGVSKISALTEIGGTTENEVNAARCKFTPRKSGSYKISITVADTHVTGSPFFKNFLAGPTDRAKIAIIQHCSTLICSVRAPHFLLVEPRDSYNNICSFPDNAADVSNYDIHIQQAENETDIDASKSLSYDAISRRVLFKFCLPLTGCYACKITYCGTPLTNGLFNVIVLDSDNLKKVQKTALQSNHEGYEGRLLAQNEISLNKPKKVYCFITSKQLFIQEYFLKLIPRRVCTFRLCPATKFKFLGTDNICSLPTLHISDGCQPSITIASKDRDIIAATFSQFMLKNIGGSETFMDKQDYFYHEVRRHHLKRPHDRIPLLVNREDLLKSSMKATKGFSLTDWCKNFEITFQGEEGLDWGGVRREWFELICASLFDPAANLFKSFHEGSQALVHPNCDRSKDLKLKYYEFAGKIVGKCLYESALGTGYRLLVRARFTRSFLAQVIGLRVHYKHFSHDDPDFYSGKILHLLESGLSALDDTLFFTDDIVLPATCQVKTCELKPGGSLIAVTDQNLPEYLDALAQFRLASQVKQEIEAFLTGLNEIIPDNLLCIFDENELELLMCGIDVYSVGDLKENHISSSNPPEFKRVLNWFWTAVSNFSEEEMARLLQFTTGCSRLPPGGFKNLSPPLQIAPSYTFGNLPTAHTCFNQLCLPDYDCYEDFVKAILFAIKEGSEGFALV